jgi:branched-chain amino acid transport system permease protein
MTTVTSTPATRTWRVPRPRTVVRLAVITAVLAAIPFLLTGLVPGLRRGWFLGLSLLDVNFALITLIAALALHVLIGRAGMISIGSAGFYALGAGVGAAVGTQLGMPFLLVLLVNLIAGGVVGAIVGLPSLKLKGLYAVLSTLAFHFIAVYLFLEYEGHFFSSTGLIYTRARIAGWELTDDRSWYLFLVIVAALVFAAAVNLSKGRIGIALTAIRDQDLAARTSAVNVGRTKVKVYAVTSSITTLAGTLYVYYLSTATVELFPLTLGIQLIAIIVIGGMTSPGGAVLGTLVWTLLPKLLDTISGLFVHSRRGSNWLGDNVDGINSALFGVAIVLILVLRPAGLIDLTRRVSTVAADALGGRLDRRRAR